MSNEETTTAAWSVWERVKTIYLTTLQSSEEKSQSERYFDLVKKVEDLGEQFVIYTINEFARDYLKKNYLEKLKSCFFLAGKPPATEIVIRTDEQFRAEIRVQPQTMPQVPVTPTLSARVAPFISTLPLDENYTFEEFVRGPSNSFARDAAEGAALNPGKKGYNPLFIHGGTGLGKTHLMQAIGNEIKRRDPRQAVCYLTAETFLNEYSTSLKNGTTNEFRDKYRNIDVLLIDDVQFFARGKEVQEEFFNTFNALQGAKKQIVMTSDVAPKDLPQIEARLISRFEGGLVQEIDSPSYETRLAIIKKKAESLDVTIPDLVLEFIADNIKSHVRAMEGALSKVYILRTRDPQLIFSNEILTRLLKENIEKENTLRKLSIEEIQKAVCNKYGVTLQQILSNERTQSLVTPRQMAMYVARKLTTKSLKEIADAFGKSHPTILHGVKTIKSRLETEAELKFELEEIISQFGSKLTDVMD